MTNLTKDNRACTELTTLGLTLNRCPKNFNVKSDLEKAESDEEGKEVGMGNEQSVKAVAKAKSIASGAKRVYQQIGRLKKLEVLALDIVRSEDTGAKEIDYACDLTLSKGWLRELAGLKNLRTLNLQADFWSKMRLAEVRFILKHWPLLTEIHLGGWSVKWWEQSHWRWLRRNRPELRITPAPYSLKVDMSAIMASLAQKAQYSSR